MLSEAKMIQKLEEYGVRFRAAVDRKDWGVAHSLYNIAHEVAVFAELDDAVLKKLFGDWDSDDGTDTNTALDNGIFTRAEVAEVNLQCCIKRNMAYEDMECHRLGKPVMYYGDVDYCARCRDKKRAARRWSDSMLG